MYPPGEKVPSSWKTSRMRHVPRSMSSLQLRQRACPVGDALQAMLREREPCGALERFAAGHLDRRRGQAFEQRVRALPRRAHRMEPVRHLALAERVRQAFAEAKLALLQGLLAAAAFGTPGGGGFEDVGHADIVAQRKRLGPACYNSAALDFGRLESAG